MYMQAYPRICSHTYVYTYMLAYTRIYLHVRVYAHISVWPYFSINNVAATSQLGRLRPARATPMIFDMGHCTAPPLPVRLGWCWCWNKRPQQHCLKFTIVLRKNLKYVARKLEAFCPKVRTFCPKIRPFLPENSACSARKWRVFCPVN